MRPLTEDEGKAVFEKLANYIVSKFWPLQSYRCIHAPGIQGKKPRASSRQGGRSTLLSPAKGSRLLCLRNLDAARPLGSSV